MFGNKVNEYTEVTSMLTADTQSPSRRTEIRTTGVMARAGR
jgi:hypothetical protein